jgi:hypothetical protein
MRDESDSSRPSLQKHFPDRGQLLGQATCRGHIERTALYIEREEVS